MNSKLRELTKAEEQVMQELWELKEAFVRDIIDRMPESKPAYNTVSTIIRILQEKGFVGHTAKGRSHCYHPLVTKDEYAAFATGNLVAGYFGNSVEKLLSFFVKEKNISVTELDEMLKKMNQKNMG